MMMISRSTGRLALPCPALPCRVSCHVPCRARVLGRSSEIRLCLDTSKWQRAPVVVLVEAVYSMETSRQDRSSWSTLTEQTGEKRRGEGGGKIDRGNRTSCPRGQRFLHQLIGRPPSRNIAVKEVQLRVCEWRTEERKKKKATCCAISLNHQATPAPPPKKKHAFSATHADRNRDKASTRHRDNPNKTRNKNITGYGHGLTSPCRRFRSPPRASPGAARCGGCP